MGAVEFYKRFGTRKSARKYVSQLCMLSESEIIAVLNMVRTRHVRFPGTTDNKSLKIVMRAIAKKLP